MIAKELEEGGGYRIIKKEFFFLVSSLCHLSNFCCCVHEVLPNTSLPIAFMKLLLRIGWYSLQKSTYEWVKICSFGRHHLSVCVCFISPNLFEFYQNNQENSHSLISVREIYFCIPALQEWMPWPFSFILSSVVGSHFSLPPSVETFLCAFSPTSFLRSRELLPVPVSVSSG